MLFIFDKDGTICHSASGQKFINSKDDQELIPGVLEKVEVLRKDGHTLAVASNQGGVAWGIMSEVEADLIVAHAATLIGAEDWRMCPYHPKGSKPEYARESTCRKPSPGMILELMESLAFLPDQTIFIGDRDEDEGAAQAAGVEFIWEKEFFSD